MPKGTSFCNDLLNLILRGIGIEGIADPAAGSPLVNNLYLALHSTDPGVGGSQTTNELSYIGYGRRAVQRNSTGWDEPSGGFTQNSELEQFDECASGTGSAAYVSIGTHPTGAGKVLYSGPLGATRSISAGIQPQFAAGSLTVTEA